MTQENKELLLKDLCARLPYGVICHYDTIVSIVGKVKSYDKLRAISEFDNKPCFQFGSNRDIFDFDNVKPYLFPFSSMGPAEYVEFVDLGDETSNDCFGSFNFNQLDWLNAHHYDYRRLIEKGLAIDATDKNIY